MSSRSSGISLGATKLGAGVGARNLSLSLDKAAHGVRGLRSALYPIIHPLAVHLYLGRIAGRIVIADGFDDAPVALRPLFSDYDSIERLFLRAFPGQSN